MTAVTSPTPSPTSSPRPDPSPSNPNAPTLPPINTNNPNKRLPSQRPQSYAQNRMSSFSTTSKLSENRSRPASFAFPAFHSSLSYTLVRDFAYPIVHPWHYGPPPEESEVTSGNSTPASERLRRLSDPANTTWESAGPQWSAGPWGGDGFFSNQQLPQMAYGDGPPYSEDEDLHSPVVVSSRHKKHKSSFAATGARRSAGKGRSPENDLDEENEDNSPPFHRERHFAGTNGEGGRFDNEDNEENNSNGQSRGLVTYPPDQDPNSMLAPNTYAKPGQRDSHFATTLPNRTYLQEDTSEESDDEDSGDFNNSRDSRYSKDYQFTIASPDEEMHGKAVALFDFARENENELPLTEGQVIWVSYRHGQGWLVAEDPKTRDKGLVPEEYVRLVRHIEGGLTMLSGEQSESALSSPILATSEPAVTPTQADHGHTPQNSNGSNGGDKRPPILSTFSTSSKDLKPYPHHLLEEQARGTPPQVVHYNSSQSNTPTITSPATTSSHGPRNFEDLKDALEEVEEGENDEEMSESEAGRDAR